MTYTVKRCLLQELLHKAGMNQTELAELLNVRVQQVNKYVLDKQKMSIQVAYNISKILNCSIEDLYEWEMTDLEVGEIE